MREFAKSALSGQVVEARTVEKPVEPAGESQAKQLKKEIDKGNMHENFVNLNDSINKVMANRMRRALAKNLKKLTKAKMLENFEAKMSADGTLNQ